MENTYTIIAGVDMISVGLLLSIAEKSNHPKHRHASIIFHNGEVVAYANNTREGHAEIRAIEVAHVLGYRKGLTLLSVAITKAGVFKLAMPCSKCEAFCRLHKIDKVLYTTKGFGIKEL